MSEILRYPVSVVDHKKTTIDPQLEEIQEVIPEEATPENQLADKNFVNNSISTDSADFKGTFTSQQDMEAVTGNKNDYCYLITQDAEGNALYNRYKWVVDTGWVYEYTIKQDDFTAAEWAAIQSGITQALVEKLNDLPTNAELTELLGNKANIGTAQDGKTANTIFGSKAFATDAVDTEAIRANNIAAILALTPGTATTTLTTSPEWKLVLVDHDDKILLGKRQDNTWYTPMDLDDLLDFVIADYGVNNN